MRRTDWRQGLRVSRLTVAGVSAILGLDADAVRYADRAVNLGASPDFPPLRIVYSSVARRRGDFGEAGAQMAKALPEEVRQSGGADAVKLIYAALGDASKKGAALDALRDLRANSAGMNSSLMVALSILWCTMLGALDSAYAVANEGLDNLRRSGPVGSLDGAMDTRDAPIQAGSALSGIRRSTGLAGVLEAVRPARRVRASRRQTHLHMTEIPTRKILSA